MKNTRYLFEAACLWSFFLLFRVLPMDHASALGGWIGRLVGPRLGASRKAHRNIEYAMPDKSPAERDKIVRDMWDNLGRVMAEYPHLEKIIHERVEIAGEEHLDAIGIDNPCIVIGSHLANWELMPFYFNYRKDWPLVGVYRRPNNPYVDRLLDRCRNPKDRGTYIAKSQKGVRAMVQALKDGKRLANLIDQKYNLGLPVPFFDKPAMTSAAPAQLAERFQCPILPLQVQRLAGCRFRITIHPSFKTGGRTDMEVMTQCHHLLEDWIREAPGQWLWLHRRWNSRALRETAGV